MSQLQTVSLLLSQINRRAFIPSGQATFTDAEILTIATEQLYSYIIPAIIEQNEEYFVYEHDVSVVSGQSGYDIPESAFNNTIREIKLDVGSRRLDLYRIAVEDIYNNTAVGTPEAFYLMNNKVHLYPTPSGLTATLKMYFEATAGTLVEATESAVISAIDTGTNVVSVTSIPSDWVTGDRFDFVSKRKGHDYRGIDYTSALVSGTDITFSSLPSDLVVGDYIMATGESSLVQIPFTTIPVLAQFTAAALLKYAGQSGDVEAFSEAQLMLQQVVKTLAPRVKGEVQKIQQSWF